MQTVNVSISGVNLMNNGFRRVMTIVLSVALFMTLFLTVPTDGKVAYAVEEVTIVGTIQNTRSY